MAQKTTVQLVDDIDGGPADETVPFGIDGVEYEIDLSGSKASDLRAALHPFVTSARKRATGRRDRRNAGHVPDRQRTADIRQWARDQGMEVNERGRIPSRVTEAYDAAH